MALEDRLQDEGGGLMRVLLLATPADRRVIVKIRSAADGVTNAGAGAGAVQVGATPFSHDVVEPMLCRDGFHLAQMLHNRLRVVHVVRPACVLVRGDEVQGHRAVERDA